MKTRSLSRIVLVLSLVCLIALGAVSAVRALVGDITRDGHVGQADMAVVVQALGSSEWAGGERWNPAADLDCDDEVNVADLAVAGRSYGSDQVFHTSRRLSNAGDLVSTLDACVDGSDQLHVAWIEDYHDVYYTRLDRYGNTLIDDVLLDSGPSTGVAVAVGCDPPGNAHVIWDCGNQACQARFDAWGYLVLGKTVYDSRAIGVEADVDLDSLGQAHALHRTSGNPKQVYTLLTATGERAIQIEDPLIADVIDSRYRKIAVDADDNVHLIWSEENGEDRLFYARLGADGETSLPARVIGQLHWDGSVTDAHRPALAVDPQGDAFVLWNDQGSTADPQLYLDEIAPDGSQPLDDYVLFADWKAGYHQDLTVDPQGSLHLVAPTGWNKTSLYLQAYGSFDNEAQPVYPMRWAFYEGTLMEPQILVGASGDIAVVYWLATDRSSHVACPEDELCYQGTGFEAAAYDPARPDLGVDVAHLDWSPRLARWGQGLTVTATVWNAGWTTSLATTARFEVRLGDDTPLAPPLTTDVAIPALAPRQSQLVTVQLALPVLPPAGYEGLSYVRLHLSVDPGEQIAESSEANNAIDSPLMVRPLPMTAGLYLIVQDVTRSVLGGGPIPVSSGTAHLVGPGIDQTVSLSQTLTVLGELPIGAAPVTYTVTWSGDGYRAASPAQVSMGRNPSDPYQVKYEPGNTVRLETDTWGTLSGSLADAGTGTPIAGATVRLVGPVQRLEVSTNAGGAFSPATDPRLGKLMPGTYAVYASAVDHARLSSSVTVPALGSATWAQEMEPTTKAYVRGRVFNQYGRPVSGASASACGANATSGSDGAFDLGQVDATCALLQVSRSGYTTASESLALTAGLEEVFDPITLSFDPPVDVLHDEGSMASWFQDESSAGLLPDPPPDANWAQKKLFEVFADEFWPSYEVQVWWGCYEYYVDVATSGPSTDRHVHEVQLRLIPKTFEAHRVAGDGEAEISGHSIKLTIAAFQDSGITTALWVVEARLVNASTGEVLATERYPTEGGGPWVALEDATRTYDFGGAAVDDWDNAEVWLYVKVGKNEDNTWTASPILRGWHFDRQVLRFDLSSGKAIGDFVLVDFPLP